MKETKTKATIICCIVSCLSGLGGFVFCCYLPQHEITVFLFFISFVYLVLGLCVHLEARTHSPKDKKPFIHKKESTSNMPQSSNEVSANRESSKEERAAILADLAESQKKLQAVEEYKNFTSDKERFIFLECQSTRSERFDYSIYGTYIYIDKKTGQPYFVATRPGGVPMGHFMFSDVEQEVLDGVPQKITYEELISLSDKTYPGVKQKLYGINETNWQEYINVITEAHVNSVLKSQFADMLKKNHVSQEIQSQIKDKIVIEYSVEDRYKLIGRRKLGANYVFQTRDGKEFDQKLEDVIEQFINPPPVFDLRYKQKREWIVLKKEREGARSEEIHLIKGSDQSYIYISLDYTMSDPHGTAYCSETAAYHIPANKIDVVTADNWYEIASILPSYYRGVSGLG